MIKFIKMGLKDNPHRESILKPIIKALDDGELVLRKGLEDFEEAFAKKIGTKYCVGVNSGTDALFLSLKALGIGQGDEVITVGHTFIATIQVIAQVGATPILIDVKDNGLMDEDLIEVAITKKTKAIIPVHLYGEVCNMGKIIKIAKKHKLSVIEDAAQAFGAFYAPLGLTQCWSFYPAKILGCYGDGGAITTNSEKIYKLAKKLRNHWDIKQTGSGGSDTCPLKWGWNSRLDNIQAVALLEKLKLVDELLAQRRYIARMYWNGLNDLPIVLPDHQSGVYQEYIVQTKDRDKLGEYLTKNGIEVLIRDTVPNHKRKGLGLSHFNLPVSERLAREVLRLPIDPLLKIGEVEKIIKTVKNFYGKV